MDKRRAEALRRLVLENDVERARIARVLHDDIGQSLSVIGAELESLRRGLAEGSEESGAKIAGIGKKVRSTSLQVGKLSQELHSPELELLGIAAAVEGAAAEFGRRQGVSVGVDCASVPENVESSGLVMLRVVRAVLEAAARRAGLTKVQVGMRGTEKNIRLTVEADGREARAAKRDDVNTGERERLRGLAYLVDAKLTIAEKKNGLKMTFVAPLRLAVAKRPAKA